MVVCGRVPLSSTGSHDNHPHTMTTPTEPPNHPPREMIERLIDLVAWAKTCMFIAAATAPRSPERTCEIKKLREAVIEPRDLITKILHSRRELPRPLLVDLRVCELAIPRLEAGAVLRTTLPREEVS